MLVLVKTDMNFIFTAFPRNIYVDKSVAIILSGDYALHLIIMIAVESRCSAILIFQLLFIQLLFLFFTLLQCMRAAQKKKIFVVKKIKQHCENVGMINGYLLLCFRIRLRCTDIYLPIGFLLTGREI